MRTNPSRGICFDKGMSSAHEIDYGALLERTIGDFRPVSRLWTVGTRLLCWILFEAMVLGLAAWIEGYANLSGFLHSSKQWMSSGLFISASVAAAFLALESAIPGREVSWGELALGLAIMVAAFGLLPFGGPGGTFESLPILIPQLLGLAALPWLCLFWAVRRGVPLHPQLTGAAVGAAAFCLAAALRPMVTSLGTQPNPGASLVVSCVLAVVFSAFAGQLWLNWIARWQDQSIGAGVPGARGMLVTARVIFPVAISAATAALILIIRGTGPHIARIPDFDRAIDNYEQALADFQPNVPSASMETMLSAYVEHGMPAYMWDFSSQGFQLVGGRWDPLPDGTPVTYTWFRGAKGGVICMFRQIEAFQPPLMVHDERHHLLFYRYRQFSFCLINVGGYGNFISVIAAPMPLKQFEHLVLAATL